MPTHYMFTKCFVDQLCRSNSHGGRGVLLSVLVVFGNHSKITKLLLFSWMALQQRIYFHHQGGEGRGGAVVLEL